MTPLKAIKKHCIECMGGVKKEVARCTAPKCPLFNYRDGHNPKLARKTGLSLEKMAKIERSGEGDTKG